MLHPRRRPLARLLAPVLCLPLLGCATPGAGPAPDAAAAERAAAPGVVEVIAFGSCAREDREQPIWDAIVAQEPDLFLLLGDNVYADIPEVPQTPAEIAEAYAALGAKAGYQRLRAAVPILATWDDHDYGKNDAGVEWALKDASQRLLLDFFEEPADSPRWDRQGVYGARVFGPVGKRVQVILLDTRYHRDALVRASPRPAGRGPYTADPDPGKTVLGAAQWAWLAEQLRVPAEVRILASSIQLVADEHGWETWGNFPAERQRLYELIDQTGAAGVVVVSGDRHLIELSRDDERGPYPIWDFTSSGLNQGPGRVGEPNRFRVGPVLRLPNFGMIRIDWDAPDPAVTFEGRGGQGELLMIRRVGLSTLREPGAGGGSGAADR